MPEEKRNREALNRAVSAVAEVLESALAGSITSNRAVSSAILDALGAARLRDDLSELFRLPASQVTKAISALGIPLFGPVSSESTYHQDRASWTSSPQGLREAFGLSISASSPRFDEPFDASSALATQLDTEWDRLVTKVRSPDPFLSYYRENVEDYADSYLARDSKRIRDFVDAQFGETSFRYLVTVGMGANEQFWHCPHRLFMQGRGDPPWWYIVDNAKGIASLPSDASEHNTLFLEFSRSGKTQEIVKTHEFLSQKAKRIVFANSGPLLDLAIAEGTSSFVCSVREEIPGRFGKNLTPMLLAPLDLLGLPILESWKVIGQCIRAWDLTSPASPPAALARYLRAAQVLRGANHIYFGTNDDALLGCADEFVQFWNEGVNKQSNDLSVSRYFGLPRDSHLNIEGLLGNHDSKAAIFLLRRNGDELFEHALRQASPRFINPAHRGLNIADVDYALAKANAEHFGTLMPTVTIEIDRPSLMNSLVLSQLWTDTVYCYSLLVGLNPGSNPEVRRVRDRSDTLLADFSKFNAT